MDGVAKALQTQDFIELEARWEHWDSPGDYLWLHFRIRKIGSTLDRFLLYVGIDNITKRKLDEEKIRFQAKLLEAEIERSRILLDQMGIATADYDVNRDLFVLVVKKQDGQHHTIIYENYLHKLESITAIHPDHIARYRDTLESVIKEPRSASMDLLADVYGKGYLWVRVHCSSLAGEDNKVCRIVGLVSELKPE